MEFFFNGCMIPECHFFSFYSFDTGNKIHFPCLREILFFLSKIRQSRSSESFNFCTGCDKIAVASFLIAPSFSSVIFKCSRPWNKSCELRINKARIFKKKSLCPIIKIFLRLSAAGINFVSSIKMYTFNFLKFHKIFIYK